MKYNQIFPGYKINLTRQLNPLFQSETNYEMKPFLKVPLINGRIITDLSRNLAIFNNENYLVEEISFAYIRRTTGEFIHGSGFQNYFFKLRQIQRPRYIEGKVFTLLTGGGKNFNIYHWFFDSLSRLYAIKDEIEKVDYFLVPEYVQEYQMQSLEYFGIKKDRVISSLNNKHLIAQELICTSHPRTATFSVRKEITNFLRDKFLVSNRDNISNDKIYPTSFYISRRDAPRRKVDNESELIFELKKKGIETVKISDYTFHEVVYLFSNALFILSTHSAALTNILFCKQGTKIVEYFPNEGFLPYYSELSESLNLYYHLIMDTKPLSEDIKSRYDIQNEESIDINMDFLFNELNKINENCIS
jgi:capsular polysaccharide biosynthesis protein